LATPAQLGKLRHELRQAGATEAQLLAYINRVMRTEFSKLEELPLKVASRAIDKLVNDREEFIKSIKGV
jgi:hypothetical protein